MADRAQPFLHPLRSWEHPATGCPASRGVDFRRAGRLRESLARGCRELGELLRPKRPL